MSKKLLPVCIIIGVLQGIIFNVLHFNEWSFFLKSHASLNVLIGSFSLYLGTIIIICYNYSTHKRLFIYGPLLSLALAFLCMFTYDYSTMPAIILTAIATYAAICMFQSYHIKYYHSPEYNKLFHVVWDNFGLMLSTTVFVGICYLVLIVWAQLFMLLGINYFSSLFFTQVFALSIIPLFVTIGLYLTLKWQEIISSIRKIIVGFCYFLLPVLTFIGCVYLGTIAYKFLSGDVNSILSLDSDQLLLIAYYFLCIVFINAVYEDGSSVVNIKKWYRAIVNLQLVILPILMLLQAYIMLRWAVSPMINQSTIGVFALLLLSFIYATTYLVGLTTRADGWLQSVARFNYSIAYVVILVAVIMSLPWKEQLPVVTNISQKVSINALKRAQDNMKILESKANIHWVSSSSSDSALVLGYRNNQPIIACVALIDGKNHIGVVESNQCNLVVKDTIHKVAQYYLFTAINNLIKWEQYAQPNNYQLIDTATSSAANICRVIFNNRIYVGTTTHPIPWQDSPMLCSIKVKNSVEKISNFQLLSFDVKNLL